MKCSPFTLVVAPGSTVAMVSEFESPSNETMDYLVEAIAGAYSYFYIQVRSQRLFLQSF